MLELEQLAALIDPLVSDMKAAEAELNHGDVQFRRRSFVRAFFALVEASVSVHKDTAFKAYDPYQPQFSVGELAILQEKQFFLDRGQVRDRPQTIPLAENFKFAVTAFARAIRSPYELDSSDRRWGWFCDAIDIRNRIAHPGLKKPMTISDEEIERLLEVTTWFREVGVALFRTHHLNQPHISF